MEIYAGDEVFDKLRKDYDSNQKGWTALFGMAEKGFDILFNQGKKQWQLKLDTVYRQNPIVVGGKIDTEKSFEAPKGIPGFGIRNITEEDIAKLLDMPPCKLLEFLKNTEPMPTDEIGHSAIAGPYLTANPLAVVSKKHAELDKKLRSELERHIQKDYGMLYV